MHASAGKRIAVSLVEDNRSLREAFAELLDRAGALRCVGAHASGEEAVRELPRAKPDVALVDINLPGMDGIECVKQLKRQLPELQILMLTRYEHSDLIFDSLRAGASGYLLKNSLPEELVQAVEQVHAGGAPMSLQIARKVVEFFHGIENPVSDLERLTAREQEILKLLAKGYFYREIGDALGISLSTVRGHVHAIYRKLHVGTRAQALAKLAD